MNRPNFKPAEGKDRNFSRRKRREFDEAQYHKLPNELRYAVKNYNHRNKHGLLLIDDNDYGQG